MLRSFVLVVTAEHGDRPAIGPREGRLSSRRSSRTPWNGGIVNGQVRRTNAELLRRQASSTAGFIRAYGMFWDAEEVNWTGADGEWGPDLLGRVGTNRPGIEIADFWEQRGIYVLYNDYGPYYVGKTVGDGMSLGKRLSNHYFGTNRSPHRDQWSRFSWFGWRGTLSSRDNVGIQQLRKLPKHLLADSRNTVNDIESLLMVALGTTQVGNLRQETFVAAVEWVQIRRAERDHFLSKVAP